MIVRRYEPKDFEQIKNWGNQFGTSYSEDQFPKTGFIVDGIAAYFLYSTDSSVCWLENMVSNKEADPALKNEALELITEAILTEAKTLGFKVCYATTHMYAIAKRAAKFGASVQAGQMFLTKKLYNDPS